MFLDAAFLRASVQHFSTRKLWLCQCGDDGAQQAMLLLEQAQPGVFRTFLPPQSQIAPLLIAPRGGASLAGMFTALPASCARVDIFQADPLLAQVPTGARDYTDVSPYGVTIAVTAGRPFASYWAERNKKLRDNIGRYLRRAQEQGSGIEFRVHTETSAVLGAFARYAELECRGWKGKAGTAIQLNDTQGVFYASVLRSFSATGRVMAFELWLDGTLVASRFSAMTGGTLVMLKTTFDENYNHFAPGRLLLYLSLEAIFANPEVRSVEFYTNAQKEQLPWADSTREISSLSLYRHKTVYRCVTLAKALRAKANPGYALQRYGDFDSLPKSARTLWQLAGEASAFSSLEWYRNLYKHAEETLGELAIFCMHNRAEDTLCIVPCVARTGQDGRVDLHALANVYSPRFEIIENRKALPTREIVERFLHGLAAEADWDSLSLFPMYRSAATRSLLEAAPLNLMHASEFFETANWHTDVTNLEDYQAARPALLRATLRRKASRLERAHPHEFRILSSPRDVAAAMAEFDAVYAASWKRAEPLPGFMSDLAEVFANRRQLRLGLLYINHLPVAGQLWVVEQGTASIYKLAYREDHSHFSPGTLLTMHMLQSVVRQDGVTRIDYLTGDDPYKRDWMSTREEMVRIRLTNLRRGRGLALGAYDQLRAWKHRWETRRAAQG
ncbi:MAG: GNAT family N-acetyltransferase [Gammaproteobacteria bacterium]|nr:GNAT family N-acetyltransferase [Gammaproteobacteria bacterium]